MILKKKLTKLVPKYIFIVRFEKKRIKWKKNPILKKKTLTNTY